MTRPRRRHPVVTIDILLALAAVGSAARATTRSHAGIGRGSRYGETGLTVDAVTRRVPVDFDDSSVVVAETDGSVSASESSGGDPEFDADAIYRDGSATWTHFSDTKHGQ